MEVSTAGSTNRITVPCPGALRAVIRPPWASTRLLAIASPSPAPPESADFTNRSNTCGRSRASIPGPVSETMKATPPGSGSTTTRTDPAGVAVAVADTGPGIDPRDLPRVFDRFVKSADSGGAGLGLAIARSLVEAHGGRITAESAPGQGTTMRFVLPAVDSSTGSSG